jgi:toxin secretion/phage lysis holin
MEAPSVGKIEVIIGAVGAGIVGFLGGWSDCLYVLVALLFIDFILGTLRAAIQHRLSSTESIRKTSVKIVLAFCLIWVGVLLDRWFGTGHTARDAVAVFFAGAQATSVLENAVPIAASVGWKVPPVLTQMLSQLGSSGRKSSGC